MEAPLENIIIRSPTAQRSFQTHNAAATNLQEWNNEAGDKDEQNFTTPTL
jgi:hypothetical protein